MFINKYRKRLDFAGIFGIFVIEYLYEKHGCKSKK